MVRDTFEEDGFNSKRTPAPPTAKALPPVDPLYEAAMRELDAELGNR